MFYLPRRQDYSILVFFQLSCSWYKLMFFLGTLLSHQPSSSYLKLRKNVSKSREMLNAGKHCEIEIQPEARLATDIFFKYSYCLMSSTLKEQVLYFFKTMTEKKSEGIQL